MVAGMMEEQLRMESEAFEQWYHSDRIARRNLH